IGRTVNNIAQRQKSARSDNDIEVVFKCLTCDRRITATDRVVKQNDSSTCIALAHQCTELPNATLQRQAMAAHESTCYSPLLIKSCRIDRLLWNYKVRSQ